MKSIIQYVSKYFKRQRPIAILDDCFPNLLTAFRVAEYNWYLERFPQLNIFSTSHEFDVVHAAYAERFPQYANRVKLYTQTSLDDCVFVYMNFLNNAYYFLSELNSRQIPFLMTLYPGGGFGLGEAESDIKLDQVLASPLLRGVIATQNVTLDYLEARECKVPIYDVYGGAINPLYFEVTRKNKFVALGVSALSICFVAERYMPQGANKGYPEFIETAERLLVEFPDLIFVVVGSFGYDDLQISDKLRSSISFRGLLTTVDLKSFFSTQDIIISPNKSFLLHPGNFDGFPTGCCVEASLCGVAVVCSDDLKQNRFYVDGEDIVICKASPENIVSAVKKLIINRDFLSSISRQGQITSRKIFDPINQLGRRQQILEELIVAEEMAEG